MSITVQCAQTLCAFLALHSTCFSQPLCPVCRVSNCKSFFFLPASLSQLFFHSLLVFPPCHLSRPEKKLRESAQHVFIKLRFEEDSKGRGLGFGRLQSKGNSSREGTSGIMFAFSAAHVS